MCCSVLPRVALFFLLAAVCPLARTSAAQQPGAGNEAPAVDAPRVISVRVVREDGRVHEEHAAGLRVQPGQAFDSASVRDAIRQLYRSGNYADIRAETFPVDAGLRLDFVVRENFFINGVRLTGLHEPPSEGLALASLRLGLGQTFRQTEFDEALDRLRQTLRDEGLYQARVAADLAPDPETRQMNVSIRIEPGRRARLGDVVLRNHTEFSDAELLARLRLKRKRELTSARLAAAAERVRDFLVKKGHLSARVVVRRGQYDAARNRLALEFDVSEGPKVQVEVAGAKISRGDLRKLLPIFQEGAVDEDLLQEGRRNIRDRLEREGYFDAEVSFSTSAGEPQPAGKGVHPAEQVITYRVEQGDSHRLVGVAIAGNRYFADELIRSRLRVVPSAFAARGRFSRRLLQADAAALRDLYLANGFRDAQVAQEIQDDYEGKNGDVFVRFKVTEGPQTRVASLQIKGNHTFSDNALLAAIGSTPGQPFSDFNVTSDRDNILALYFNEGFPEARFTSVVEPSQPSSAPAAAHSPSSPAELPGSLASPTVRLTYRIVEGPQTRVRGVLLGGYRHTRRGVVAREVRVAPGEPLREGDVVESQRRLYNLGIFNRVSIAPQNPGGTETEKSVVVQVEEARRFTVAYGGGVELQRLASASDPVGVRFRASPRGIIELTKANFTGRADTFALKVRGSTLQGRALASYTTPNTFGDPRLSLQVTAFADKTRDINTFSSTRYEGSVQLAQNVSPLTTLFYRYSFRKVLVNALRIPTDEIPLFNQPTLVSSFGITWFRDRRDNPADAAKGNFNNVDLSLSDERIGSSASFVRFYAQNASYHPYKRRFTFARSLRFGVLKPYGDTVSLTFPPPTAPPLPIVIPLPERFFAGGGTSLRSFALNQAGPRDPSTGFPVGGQALLVLNQELRFPMRLPFIGGRLGGALFYDAGNVYSRAGRITFRASPPRPIFDPANPQKCQFNCTNELNYLSHTIGMGFRYATPVGPVRVDLGYQLNPARFVIPCPAGPAGCQRTARLPRFQIFFNLGSIF